jgi:hypothetical protein
MWAGVSPFSPGADVGRHLPGANAVTAADRPTRVTDVGSSLALLYLRERVEARRKSPPLAPQPHPADTRRGWKPAATPAAQPHPADTQRCLGNVRCAARNVAHPSVALPAAE